MARSHWMVMASWVGVFTAAALACGDSVTGDGIPDNPDAGNLKDGSSSGYDSSLTFPDTGSSSGDDDTGALDSSTGIDGGLPTVSVQSLDFQETDCGSTAAPQSFTIDNPSGSPVAYTSQLVKGDASPYTISPDSGSIPAGQSLTVTVTPKAVPIPSSTSANGIGDTLKLTIGPTNTSIDLKQTAHGAVIRYSLPSGIDFGNTPISASTPINSAFAIANAGNAEVPITLSITPDPNITPTGSAFSLTGTVPTNAALGLTPAQVTFAPADTVSYTGGVHVVAGTGPLCDVLPADMPLKGTGTNGVITVTPASISFGNAGRVDCGTTANVQRVRVTNTSNGAVSYTATLGKGTTFYGVSTGTAAATAASVSGTIPAAPSGGTSFVDINVQPKAIPGSGATMTADFYADTLDVQTTSTTGSTDNQVALHETANGAILTRGVSGIGFGNVAAGTVATQQYTFSNTGNVDITVAMANALTTIFSQPATVTIPAGGFATPTVSFAPPLKATYSNGYTDSATLVQSGTPVALCGGLPGGLGLSGVGVAPTTTLSTNNVAFGQVPCGTQTITPKVVHVTNNGPTVQFDLSLRKGAASQFTLGSPVLAIAAGQTADITITPKAMPTNLLNVSDLTDVIDLSPEPGDASVPDNRPPLTVAVAITPQGAIINFANHGSSIAFPTTKGPATSSQTVTLNNIGNLPATINFTATTSTPATTPNVFSVSPTSTTLIAGASNFLSTVTFSPPTPLTPATSYTGTWTAAVDTSSTTLCAPLPFSAANTPEQGPITLSGTGAISP